MIDNLLKYIKNQQNKDFIHTFASNVNQTHRVLLLETAISYDNLEIFKFLKKCTVLSDEDYYRIAFINIKNQKEFNKEYSFFESVSQKALERINSDNIRNICKLGDNCVLNFLEHHPLVVHINFNWFIHYSLLFKNEKFLETIFNSPLSKNQVMLCCMAAIHHKEQTFLPIILESAMEHNVDIDFKSDPVYTRKQIVTYLSRIVLQKNGPKIENIIDLLVEEQIKAMEVTLYEITKNINNKETAKKVQKF